ncbi:MAG: calcium-binding protein [Candidatus Caenarcaniphilales bacterium]|nr:calcium-binding protein [Candidatus Caenarcaniphilales bacterium]
MDFNNSLSLETLPTGELVSSYLRRLGIGQSAGGFSIFESSISDEVFLGEGNDIYYGFSGHDFINGEEGDDQLNGGEGDDLILGGAGDDNLVGGTGRDELKGGAGDDTLNGGNGGDRLDGGRGADTMIGGKADDVYVVDNVGDVVTELADEGNDRVRSSISYTLGDNVEELTLFGDSNDLIGIGNDLDNILIGSNQNDTLDGGLGSDQMSGGRGNDIYIVDSSGDAITEQANQGTDTVRSSIDFTLPANVENLELLGSTDLNGTGNSLNNMITGNDGANILNGGSGADTLIGGLGDDIYIVDNPGDTVIEEFGEGTDTVESSVSFSLSENVENLELTGSGDIDGAGNDLANQITGNTGANRLDGGIGADILIGGAGNDTYIVDDSGDQVIENTNEGTDTVISSIDYILGANLENLTLSGDLAIDGTGNSLDNTLIGNDQNNTLDGQIGDDLLIGGAGDDHLIGGSGDDSLAGGIGNDFLEGGTGDDLYTGYESGAGFGSDIIFDSAGADDVLDLSSLTIDFTPGSDPFSAQTIGGAGGMLDLVIDFGGGDQIVIYDYFGMDIFTQGSGLIETIVFANDSNFTFSEASALV